MDNRKDFKVGDVVCGKDDYSFFIHKIIAMEKHDFIMHVVFDSEPDQQDDSPTALPYGYELHYPLRKITEEEMGLFKLLFDI